MLRNFFVIALTFVSFFSYSEVNVIGLTINQDTKRTVSEKYTIKNNESQWRWDLIPSEILIDEIKKADISFDGETLKGVWLTLPKDKFGFFYEILRSKYPLDDESIPFVGDKYAIFEKDNVLIWIQAKHMSFDMSVVYMDKKFKEKLDKDINETKQKHKNKVMNQL
ncbi:TPA: hypothetical protein ACS70L_003320 [Providencia alcalifaciens]